MIALETASHILKAGLVPSTVKKKKKKAATISPRLNPGCQKQTDVIGVENR